MSVAALLWHGTEVTVSADLLHARVADREIVEVEERDLETKLGLALYEVLHLRRSRQVPVHARMVRDAAFEQRLAAAIPHDGIRLPTVLHRRDDEHDLALVEWAGVRVWVDGDRVREDPRGRAVLHAPPEHAAISPGFLLAHGSAALVDDGPLLRAYVHVADAGAAETIWGVALRAMEAAGVAYRAKISSVPWFYPRSDTLTIYLPRGSWAAGRLVADAVRGLDGLGRRTSAFCHRLAPGVAVAWEPADRRPGRQHLSFGEHRAGVVARALVESARTGRQWREVLAAEWRAAGVDPAAPWRNTHSPDIATSDDGGTAPLPEADRRGDGTPFPARTSIETRKGGTPTWTPASSSPVTRRTRTRTS